MGYSRIKQQDHNNTYYTEFVIDHISDVATLPTQPETSSGSVAICIENSEVYMLTTSGEWVMI
jgi:hypothetical protein